jgi:hypothetical protein
MRNGEEYGEGYGDYGENYVGPDGGYELGYDQNQNFRPESDLEPEFRFL